MKKYLVLLLTLLVSTFSLNSFAFTAPPKPADNTYVLDQTGKLSGDQVAKLNTKIEALNKSTKNEYAIVLLKTLDGAAIEDAAQDTFRAWGVGKANLNNGVMIMVALAERKTRIQTGKNAEGDLPDLLCKDILDRTLKPLLKKGDFYGGLDATLDSVVSHMESREKEKAVVAAPKELPNAAPADVAATSQSNAGSGGAAILLVMLFGGIAIFGLIAFFSYRSSKRRQEEEQLDMLRRQALKTIDNMERERCAQRRADQRLREAQAKLVPVVLPVPSHEPPKHVTTVSPSTSSYTARNVAVGTALGAAGLGAAALAATAISNKRNEDAERRKREESARRRREEEEENAARRRRDEEEAASRRRSEESSSSSWSSSSSSSSSSWDSGGSSGFGGGDSGGGGGSSDF